MKFLSHASRAVDAVLGGWPLSPITLAQTGPYLMPYDSNTDDSQANLGEAGRPGNAGVGIYEGPGTVTVAGGLAKSFLLTEKVRMRFEATFSDILNHPKFAAPPTDVSSTSTFGVTQTVQTAENRGNRVGQLSLRIDF
jgi:hypothetical protein